MKPAKNIIKNQITKKSILDKIELFFKEKKHLFLWLAIAVGAIMSALLFDVKASLSGDDCDYVMYADKFIHHFYFPSFRGPLYPIALSPFVLLFGVNLVLLKALSAVFILLSIWFLYKSFEDKIPYAVLMPSLLLISICPYLFFYASQTFSEPFFMFVQSLLIYFFSKYFIVDENLQSQTLKGNVHKYLIIGALVLALGLTRSIGFGFAGAVILFFATKKQWKNMAYIVLSIIVCFFAFQIIKKLLWPDAGSAYDIKNYLAINYYNLNQGMETFSGFVDRLIINSNVYLSRYLCLFLGFRLDGAKSVLPIVTIIIYILYFVCLAAVAKRNRALFFAGLYVGVMNIASFIILQKYWEQDRLILIYYPLMLTFILGGIYYIFKSKKAQKLAIIFPLLLCFILIGNIINASTKISRNVPVLVKNAQGDMLYGLTPDWQNFIKASEWAAKNLPKDAVIASRKPTISYIYSGREFIGIQRIPTVTFDEMSKNINQATIAINLQQNRNETLTKNLDYIIMGRFKIDGKDVPVLGVYNLGNDTAAVNYITTNEIKYVKFIDLANQLKNDQSSVAIYSPDLLKDKLKEMNVKYLLLASLRTNPQKNTGGIINTIHIFLQFFDTKYPNRLRKIQQFGKSEPCEIIEIIEN